MKSYNFLATVCLLVLLMCAGEAVKTNVWNIQPTFQMHIDSCPKQQLNNKIYNTSIPTTLHLDLLRNNQIPDPFIGNNYQQLKWVSQCRISYMKNFTIQQLQNWGNSQNINDYQVIEIVFEGIDTYATVYFNGKPILYTDNAFVEYRVEVAKGDFVMDGNNTVMVSIVSTRENDEKGQRSNRMPFDYAHTRKACYQYSWDWAPYLNTMGIWKPIYILGYTRLTLNYIWIRNRQIHKNQAILNFAISLNSTKTASITNYLLKLTNNNTNQTIQYKLNSTQYNYIDMLVKQPRLWWPNGIGQPYLYIFKVQLIYRSLQAQEDVVVDYRNITYGIRTVQLNQQNNQFTIIINGYNIYCKGANYVPADMFYPRLINPHYQSGNTIQNILNDAVQSHFNMIRIWGGGQYQSMQFLELASRKGIMIFYDFMFSDSIYPSNDQFLRNVEIEAKQQIVKARNYPAVVLWCGNNQILQGIYSWGWKRANYEEDYRKLFQSLLPKILEKYHPDVPYIPSSPVKGVGNAGFNRGGDVHYWGVWAGQAPFQSYKNALGPFNSQFGTQSLPVWETIKSFTKPEQRSYDDRAFAAHERHNSRFGTLRKYIGLYGDQAKDFESQAYLSGLVQAYGVEIAIKYQRMAKPHSYGTLYWQLNDAWPAISWSSIDYYGRWKPLQYMAKRLYPDVAVFIDQNIIRAVNDNLYAIDGFIKIKLQKFDGTILLDQLQQIKLAINQVKQVMKIDQILYREIQQQVVVYAQIIAGRQKQMSSTSFFAPFKKLKLQPSKLYIRYVSEYNVIILKTDKFIKNLYISNTQKYIRLSDNYFDMIAEKQYKVEVKTGELKDIKGTMLYRGYRQIHMDEVLEVVIQEQ